MPDKAPDSKWADLAPRVISGLVLAGVALGALWAGGFVWPALIALAAVLMFWELSPLCEPGIAGVRRGLLALTPLLLTGAVLVASAPVEDDMLRLGQFCAPPLPLAQLLGFILPLAAGVVLLRAGRMIWIGYGALALVGAYFLGFARAIGGVPPVLALVMIVVISDVAGYLFGRLLGGPKFWPRVSPKKTWSGTVAGWIGAALFGAFVMPGLLSQEYGYQAPVLASALAAALLAFAGQMGDIVESAMKRHAGVKDSSNLIPGHGGVLDRFDALIAASALAGLFIIPPYLFG